ncbi:g-D-glutamyl-meso-diaminopimelate peptidase [Terribacillus halophilus]|uniref:G-D-glutamyl-meso-diaminopimelate peptidase n=1 Tax=Terribacillus halophilus TaxID=361279 RepID=A0A1G6VBJ0_9BACI|nr:M14 family metallocarboxypeptidase [Terribacillus halophilus]SDD51029.1 g-D-glutamyl-meso-diaminopimelate peptidase [Terribacillus halophilus]
MEIILQEGCQLSTVATMFHLPTYVLFAANPFLSTHVKPQQPIQVPGYAPESVMLDEDMSDAEVASAFKLPLRLVHLLYDSSYFAAGARLILPRRVTEPVTCFRQPYDYATCLQDIRSLHQLFPFFTMRTIYKSILGKPVTELRIGKGKKRMHINASFHGNEWITSLALIRFVNDYLAAVTHDKEFFGYPASKLYRDVTLSIVPMVNPDGVDLVIHGSKAAHEYEELVHFLNEGSNDFKGWKANIIGVDLNKQYPAKWEYEQLRKPKLPGPRDFPGRTPLTEPESIGMYELVNAGNFDSVVALHTQGEEIYWSFEEKEPPSVARMVSQMEQLSGYKGVKELDNYAGFKDWFIASYLRAGFTIELGRGENPLPIEQVDTIYEKLCILLMVILTSETG